MQSQSEILPRYAHFKYRIEETAVKNWEWWEQHQPHPAPAVATTIQSDLRQSRHNDTKHTASVVSMLHWWGRVHASRYRGDHLVSNESLLLISLSTLLTIIIIITTHQPHPVHGPYPSFDDIRYWWWWYSIGRRWEYLEFRMVDGKISRRQLHLHLS